MNALEVGSVTASYLRVGTDVHLVTGETESYYVNIPLHGRTLWRASRLLVAQRHNYTGALATPARDGSSRSAWPRSSCWRPIRSARGRWASWPTRYT